MERKQPREFGVSPAAIRLVVLVDPLRLGLTTSAYVALTVRQNTRRDPTERLREVPEVEHMALVGGDLMLLVRARDSCAPWCSTRCRRSRGVLCPRDSARLRDLANR